jgi:flagellar motor protein MotB
MLYGQVPEQLFKARTAKFISGIGDPKLVPRIQGEKLIWDLSKELNFGNGEADLREPHVLHLRKVAKLLPDALKATGDQCRVVVLGSADSAPVSSDPLFGNWRLSAIRSLNVLRFLYACGDCGYDTATMRKKLTLSGLGDTKANAKASKSDRRVDLIIDCSPEKYAPPH